MNDSNTIKVLIVDDHPIMRAGISYIIKAQSDMQVVGEAGTGELAIEIFEHHRPDITLMDLRLPGISGVETIRKIRNRHPEARFIVLTSFEGDEDVHQALEAGAGGYLVKGMPHEVLISALRRVHRGARFLPPTVTRVLESRTPHTVLSLRERDVMALMVAGKSNKEIGASLDITEATVKRHVGSILTRLDAADRTQAVVVALRRGLARLAE